MALCAISMPIFSQGWVKSSDLPGSARHHPICFTLGDTAFCVAGVSNSNTMLNDFYSYDATTDTWFQKADYPGPNRGFGVGLDHNNKGYIGFGITASPNTVLRDLWEFDPTTQAWTELASLPTGPRFHPAFVAKDSMIYVGLGNNGSSNLNDWWQYNINTDSWTRKTNFPGARRHHPYYFVANNEIFVGLGHGSIIYDDWYKYDDVNDTWTKMNAFPGYARVAGAHFSRNGKGYVVGGQNQFHSTPSVNEVWEYNPINDSWAQMGNCPTGGRWAPGSFMVGNQAFFGFGEAISGSSQADIWSINFADIVSLDEIKVNSLTIYPNPASSTISISIDDFNSNDMNSLKFMNITGQVVKEVSISQAEISVDVSEFPVGVYTVFINDINGNGGVQKLIIEK